MAARISLLDLADATGIAPDLLAAEVTRIQRASSRPPPPPAPPEEAPAGPTSARPPHRVAA